MAEEMSRRLQRRQLGPKAAFDSSRERFTMVPIKTGFDYLPTDEENARCGGQGITSVFNDKPASHPKVKREVRR